MHFNHLMKPQFIERRKCKKTKDTCYFVPAGNIRSTQGENVHMTMICRHCGSREDIFLSKEEYSTQQQLIQKEIRDAQTS